MLPTPPSHPGRCSSWQRCSWVAWCLVDGRHRFLSPEWIQAALAIRDEFRGQLPETEYQVRVNLRIVDAPFDSQVVEAFIDTEQHGAFPDLGQLPDAPTTVTLDYTTAEALFLDEQPEALGVAFFSGQLQVEGDLTQLLLLQAVTPTDDQVSLASEVNRRLKGITAGLD